MSQSIPRNVLPLFVCLLLFAGCQDDKALLEVALPDEVTPFDPDADLLAHYPLDEGAGEIARDVSGNEYHGTLMNVDPATSPWVIDGKIGGALKFGPTYVDLPDLSLETFTISAWWSTTSSGRHTIIGWGDGSGDYIQIRDNWRYKTRFGGWTGVNGLIDYASDGTYYHVVMTRDDDLNVLIYHNGVLAGDSETPSWGPEGWFKPPFNFNISCIGRVDSTWNAYNGNIDDVRIYERALSPEEVRDLYQLGNGSFEVVEEF
jgi:hypothetical protein